MQTVGTNSLNVTSKSSHIIENKTGGSSFNLTFTGNPKGFWPMTPLPSILSPMLKCSVMLFFKMSSKLYNFMILVVCEVVTKIPSCITASCSFDPNTSTFTSMWAKNFRRGKENRIKDMQVWLQVECLCVGFHLLDWNVILKCSRARAKHQTYKNVHTCRQDCHKILEIW